MSSNVQILILTPCVHVFFRETYEKERSKLQTVNQDLTSAVEKLKDQLSSRVEEVQKFKHQATVLEQKLLDSENKLHKAQDSMMSHDDIQDKLNKR